MSEIKAYNIPKRSALLQSVDDYDYDDALHILKEIAAEIGVRIG